MCNRNFESAINASAKDSKQIHSQQIQNNKKPIY